jgi:Fe2+ transport system protein FeoA
MRTVADAPLRADIVISDVLGEALLCQRLREMGFHPGCHVRVLGRAPFNGAFIIQLHESVLALRQSEAECLIIQNP